MRKAFVRGLALVTVSALPLEAQAPLERGVDSIVQAVLQSTGVPSASVAVVQGGRLAYAQAYGRARLEPEFAARPTMRYSIGSISKQFAAAAILLLQQEGKLSLDDRVSHFFPDLTRARDVTIRQLLSHTSGYQDYWPQDYVPPFMLDSISGAGIEPLFDAILGSRKACSTWL